MRGIHQWIHKLVRVIAGHGCGKLSLVALVPKRCLENVVEEVVVGRWLEGSRVVTLSSGCPELKMSVLVCGGSGRRVTTDIWFASSGSDLDTDLSWSGCQSIGGSIDNQS